MAEQQESFADVIRELVGDRTQREVAAAGGVSHAYVNDWLQGRIPSLRALTGFVDRAGISGEMRARLFRAAGYIDRPPVVRGRQQERQLGIPFDRAFRERLAELAAEAGVPVPELAAGPQAQGGVIGSGATGEEGRAVAEAFFRALTTRREGDGRF